MVDSPPLTRSKNDDLELKGTRLHMTALVQEVQALELCRGNDPSDYVEASLDPR